MSWEKRDKPRQKLDEIDAEEAISSLAEMDTRSLHKYSKVI